VPQGISVRLPQFPFRDDLLLAQPRTRGIFGSPVGAAAVGGSTCVVHRLSAHSHWRVRRVAGCSKSPGSICPSVGPQAPPHFFFVPALAAPFSSPSAWTPFSASSTVRAPGAARARTRAHRPQTSMQTPANSYHVIVFPADGRAPHLADMPVTHDFYAYGLYNPAPPALAHPEVHMEYIAEGAHAHRFIVRPSPVPPCPVRLTCAGAARGRARGHDRQARAPVRRLLPRARARRDAVRGEQVRARDPGRARAAGRAVARRPRRRRLQRRVRPLFCPARARSSDGPGRTPRSCPRR
jgi:hypothetical protein